MSSTDMSLVFEGIARDAIPREQRGALHIMLLPGEILRLPRQARSLRVVTGSAWITCEGRDLVLERGQAARLAWRRDCALVSGLGQDPLALELRG